MGEAWMAVLRRGLREVEEVRWWWVLGVGWWFIMERGQ